MKSMKLLKYISLSLMVFFALFLLIKVDINKEQQQKIEDQENEIVEIEKEFTVNSYVTIDFVSKSNPMTMYDDIDISDEIINAFDQIKKDDRVLTYNHLDSHSLYPINENVYLPDDLLMSQMPYEYNINEMLLIANDCDKMINIIDGTYDIVEGRFYTMDEVNNGSKVILVTSEFAKINSKQIGDKIQFLVSSGDYDGFIEYEIIGLFNNNFTKDYEVYDDFYQYSYSNSPAQYNENTLLAPVTSIIPLVDNHQKFMSGGETFLKREIVYRTFAINIQLKDRKDLEQFILDYEDLLKPYYSMSFKNELVNYY